MQWMMSHQQTRCNLAPDELIYANSMIADEIALENKERIVEGGRLGGNVKNGNVASIHLNGGQKSHTLSTNTRERVAKMSDVGVGTVAKFSKVMNSDE